MWFVRFYDGMLQSTLKFLLGLNNTSLGLFIMCITFYFYHAGNHDGALWFGGVATTLLGMKSDAQHKNTNIIDAPNATSVTNSNQPNKTDLGDAPNAEDDIKKG